MTLNWYKARRVTFLLFWNTDPVYPLPSWTSALYFLFVCLSPTRCLPFLFPARPLPRGRNDYIVYRNDWSNRVPLPLLSLYGREGTGGWRCGMLGRRTDLVLPNEARYHHKENQLAIGWDAVISRNKTKKTKRNNNNENSKTNIINNCWHSWWCTIGSLGFGLNCVLCYFYGRLFGTYTDGISQGSR